MFCPDIPKEFRHPKYTVLIVLIALVLQIPLSFVSDNNIVLFVVATLLSFAGYYVSLFDPVQLCGKFAGDCKFRTFLLAVIIRILVFPIIYHLSFERTRDKTMSLMITIVLTIVSLIISIRAFLVDPTKLVYSRFSVMRCSLYRIIVYSLLFSLDVFMCIQILKVSKTVSESASIYGLPSSWGILTYPLYILTTVSLPFIMDILTIDDSVRYEVSDLIKNY